MLDPKNIDLKSMTISCLPLYWLARKARLVITNQVKTAAITKEGTLFLNLGFIERMAKLSHHREEFVLEKIIRHELMHVLYRHHDRFPQMTYKANVATDCEINTSIYHKENSLLSLTACIPKNYGLPDFKSAEYYFNNLKDEDLQDQQDGEQEGQSNQQSGQGQGQQSQQNQSDGQEDNISNRQNQSEAQENSQSSQRNGQKKDGKSGKNHGPQSDPGNLGTIINEQEEKQLRDEIKKQTGKEVGRGQITPEDIAKGWSANKAAPEDEKFVEPRNEREVRLNDLVIPLFHKFLGGHARVSSWSRPSRRIYDDKHFYKGVSHKKDRVLFAFDVSGSIPIEASIKAACIAKSIVRRLNQEVDYCAFDTSVHEIKRNRRHFDFVYTQGGTIGMEVIKKFKQGRWNKLVIFTDGACEWGEPDKNILVMRIDEGWPTPYQEFDLQPFFKELNVS